MIKADELIRVGQLNKPHALKGEINFTLSEPDLFDEVDPDMLFVQVDGLFVPFFIEEYRFKSDDAGIIHFQDINSDTEARELSNLPIFLHHDQTSGVEVLLSANPIIGFSIIDSELGPVGEIVDVDDSTMNVLLIVQVKGDTVYIPFADEYINQIDESAKIIYTTLPDGLFDDDGDTY